MIKEEERTDGNGEEKRAAAFASFKIALITDGFSLQQLLVKMCRAAQPSLLPTRGLFSAAAPTATNCPKTAAALTQGCVTARISNLIKIAF